MDKSLELLTKIKNSLEPLLKHVDPDKQDKMICPTESSVPEILLDIRDELREINRKLSSF